MNPLSRARQYLSRSDSPPPADRASPEDVQQYNMAYLRNHPQEADLGPEQNDGTLEMGKAATIDGTRYRAEFPWLYDPNKGVPWDFNPVETRTLAQQDTWVEMLVETINKEIAETPWTITEEENARETAKRLDTHPDEREPIQKDLPDRTAEEIFDLLRNPNPDHTWHDLIQMLTADMLEVGSQSVVKAFPGSMYDADDRLRRDPERMTPRALMPSAPEVWTKDYQDKTGLLDGYWQFERRSNPGGSTAGHSRGQTQATFFQKDEVAWNDMSPRSNRRYGLPPTLLVQRFVKATDLAITQEQQYLSKGSVPSGAIQFPDWDKQRMEEWKTENEENIKGKPWKMLMFAGTEADYVPFSYNFDEMQFTERMKWYARVIASAFQVPTAVVGIEPERVNYNTFQGERENFESNTLGPYIQELERYINSNLVGMHWDGYRFEFQPGMSESTRGMISERVRGEWNDNLIQRSTALRELGRELPDDAADGYKDDVVEGSEDNPLDGLQMSVEKADDSNDDDALRNTDEWYLFDVQPEMVADLEAQIADDVSELFDAVLSDDEIQATIERLAADMDDAGDGTSETSKSLTDLSRRLNELLSELGVAESISEAIRTQTAAAISETIADTPEADVDSEAIQARLADRDVGFANRYADELAEQIRDTVGQGFEAGNNSQEIAEDISAQADIEEGWGGAERIARQELQVATGEARSAVADELNKVEVWNTAGDDRVRDAHQEMDGLWKAPGENWVVEYERRGRQTESVPGDSEPGIGCRCVTLLRDREEVDSDDYAGDGSLN